MPVQKRRQQLVAAAFRVVAREGVAAASTRRIASEAKVPAAVVHYCFHSVDELIDSMMAGVFAETAELAAVALRPRGGVSESLRAALNRIWQGYRADPARQRAVFDLVNHALGRPAAAELVRQHQSRLGELAERFLADVASANGIQWAAPADVLGRALVSTLDGVLMNWLIDRDSARAEEALAWLAASIAGNVT